jgi:hypothetical protein
VLYISTIRCYNGSRWREQHSIFIITPFLTTNGSTASCAAIGARSGAGKCRIENSGTSPSHGTSGHFTARHGKSHMSNRLCECCELEISQQRLEAIPNAKLCAICQQIQGDVPKVTGIMVWFHKTAPEIVIGRDAELLRPYDRRGFHAQLPMNSKNNPRMLQSLETQNLSQAIKLEPPLEYEVVSYFPSNCHPDRPRVNVKGDCYECLVEHATAWYTRRWK